MYGVVFASTSAPWRTCCGEIPCVTSMISTSGAIDLITPWQVPTKSSWSPKSLRKVTNTRATLRAGSEHGFDQALEVVCLSLAHDSHAGFPRRGGRLWTVRHA